jgi:glucosylceramidase
VVCVCNSSYCDTIEPIERKANIVTVIRSSRAGLRFHRSLIQLQPVDGHLPDHTAPDLTITFNGKQSYQQILGFGMAFTDAAGIASKSLGSQMTQLIIDNYFSKSGLQYSMGRIPIGGTDFSTRKYTYDDNNDGDFALERFALQPEDFEYKVMTHSK